MVARAGHPEAPYEALLAAGRTRWSPGERVRFYRVRGGGYVWVPEEADEAPAGATWEAEAEEDEGEEELEAIAPAAPIIPQKGNVGPSRRQIVGERRDYDVNHYLQALVTSYAARLRKAFAPDDFEQLFRVNGQPGLFDRPVEAIQPRWIRCTSPET